MGSLRITVMAGLAMLLVSGCVTTTSTGDRMSHMMTAGEEVRIEGGGFYETCDNWPLGQEMEYNFEASAPVSFDVHYHTHAAGKVFAAKGSDVRTQKGKFMIASGDVHCCMWKNNNSQAVTVRFKVNPTEKQ